MTPSEVAWGSYGILTMCGRFTRKNMQNLAKLLWLKSNAFLSPRYNIAPSQLVACVRTNLNSNPVTIFLQLVLAWNITFLYGCRVRAGPEKIVAETKNTPTSVLQTIQARVSER